MFAAYPRSLSAISRVQSDTQREATSFKPNLPCNVISTSGSIGGRTRCHKRGMSALPGRNLDTVIPGQGRLVLRFSGIPSMFLQPFPGSLEFPARRTPRLPSRHSSRWKAMGIEVSSTVELTFGVASKEPPSVSSAFCAESGDCGSKKLVAQSIDKSNRAIRTLAGGSFVGPRPALHAASSKSIGMQYSGDAFDGDSGLLLKYSHHGCKFRTRILFGPRQYR